MNKKLVLFSILCLSSWHTISFAKAKLSDSLPDSIMVSTVPHESEGMSWEFYSSTEQPSQEDLSNCSPNYRFGKTASFYYNLFKEAYVTKETVVPGDPTKRTIIRKPNIYNAVKHIEKYLTKSLKQDKSAQSEIEDQFCQVLKISLAAIDSETTSFEGALNESRKDPQSLLDIFGRVRLKNIY